MKIARASLSELGYGLHACMWLQYINNAELAGFEIKLRSVGGPLQGLIKKRRLKNGVVSASILSLTILSIGAAWP